MQPGTPAGLGTIGVGDDPALAEHEAAKIGLVGLLTTTDTGATRGGHGTSLGFTAPSQGRRRVLPDPDGEMEHGQPDGLDHHHQTTQTITIR